MLEKLGNAILIFAVLCAIGAWGYIIRVTIADHREEREIEEANRALAQADLLREELLRMEGKE